MSYFPHSCQQALARRETGRLCYLVAAAVTTHIKCQQIRINKSNSHMTWSFISSLSLTKRCDQRWCHFLRQTQTNTFSLFLFLFLALTEIAAVRLLRAAQLNPTLTQMEAEIRRGWLGEGERGKAKQLQVFVWGFFTVGTGGHGDTTP